MPNSFEELCIMRVAALQKVAGLQKDNSMHSYLMQNIPVEQSIFVCFKNKKSRRLEILFPNKSNKRNNIIMEYSI